MAIDFPNSPTNGQVFNDSGKTWTYSSATNSWDLTGGMGSFTISDTPPTYAAAGDVWFESDTSKTYIYYDSAWVEFGGETGPPGSFIVSDTAPSNPAQGTTWYQSSTGRTFVYYDSFWVEYGANAGSSDQVSSFLLMGG